MADNTYGRTYRLDPFNHMVICLHEAAHAAVFHYVGFHVVGASAIGLGSKLNRTLGRTEWIGDNSDNPDAVKRVAMGSCAGYVVEMLGYGIEEFTSFDLAEFCNGADEVCYSDYRCDYFIGDNAFNDVVQETVKFLLRRDVSRAVSCMADILAEHGKIDHRQIAEAMSGIRSYDDALLDRIIHQMNELTRLSGRDQYLANLSTGQP